MNMKTSIFNAIDMNDLGMVQMYVMNRAHLKTLPPGYFHHAYLYALHTGKHEVATYLNSYID
jgi:hypothetical protein